MYLMRWLDRKYPVSSGRIYDEFYTPDDEYFYKLKKQNYKVGVLTEDYDDYSETYPKGTLVIYKRIKSYDDVLGTWDGGFDYVGTFKCIDRNLTHSGYHTIKCSRFELEELTK